MHVFTEGHGHSTVARCSSVVFSIFQEYLAFSKDSISCCDVNSHIYKWNFVEFGGPWRCTIVQNALYCFAICRLLVSSSLVS